MGEKKPIEKIELADLESEKVELYYDPEYKIQITQTNCTDCPVTIIQKGQPPNPDPPKGGGGSGG